MTLPQGGKAKRIPPFCPLPSQPVIDEQLFQFLGAHGLGNDVYFIRLDLPGQGPVFIGLGVRLIEFDDGLPVDLGLLDDFSRG